MKCGCTTVAVEVLHGDSEKNPSELGLLFLGLHRSIMIFDLAPEVTAELTILTLFNQQ